MVLTLTKKKYLPKPAVLAFLSMLVLFFLFQNASTPPAALKLPQGGELIGGGASSYVMSQNGRVYKYVLGGDVSAKTIADMTNLAAGFNGEIVRIDYSGGNVLGQPDLTPKSGSGGYSFQDLLNLPDSEHYVNMAKDAMRLRAYNLDQRLARSIYGMNSLDAAMKVYYYENLGLALPANAPKLPFLVDENPENAFYSVDLNKKTVRVIGWFDAILPIDEPTLGLGIFQNYKDDTLALAKNISLELIDEDSVLLFMKANKSKLGISASNGQLLDVFYESRQAGVDIIEKAQAHPLPADLNSDLLNEAGMKEGFGDLSNMWDATEEGKSTLRQFYFEPKLNLLSNVKSSYVYGTDGSIAFSALEGLAAHYDPSILSQPIKTFSPLYVSLAASLAEISYGDALETKFFTDQMAGLNTNQILSAWKGISEVNAPGSQIKVPGVGSIFLADVPILEKGGSPDVAVERFREQVKLIANEANYVLKNVPVILDDFAANVGMDTVKIKADLATMDLNVNAYYRSSAAIGVSQGAALAESFAPKITTPYLAAVNADHAQATTIRLENPKLEEARYNPENLDNFASQSDGSPLPAETKQVVSESYNDSRNGRVLTPSQRVQVVEGIGKVAGVGGVAVSVLSSGATAVEAANIYYATGSSKEAGVFLASKGISLMIVTAEMAPLVFLVALTSGPAAIVLAVVGVGVVGWGIYKEGSRFITAIENSRWTFSPHTFNPKGPRYSKAGRLPGNDEEVTQLAADVAQSTKGKLGQIKKSIGTRSRQSRGVVDLPG
tara:strand:+ start:555 stop:2894 length:2340 start_codon:yes stop_codon:yes gene_type:complete